MPDLELNLDNELGLGEDDRFFEEENDWTGETALDASMGESPLNDFEDEPMGFVEGFTDFEEGEPFSWSSIGRFVKRAAPVLKQIARKAAPIVGAAIGGPAGAQIGSIVSRAIREGEADMPLGEDVMERDYEPVMTGPLTELQGVGEGMAALAARAGSGVEAEAQMGGAIMIALTPQDREALKGILPALTRGAAVLTRVLRNQPAVRPVVRVVPTIVKRTVVSLRKQAAAGRPITNRNVARAMALQTQRVLSAPAVCARAMHRNARATRAIARRTRENFGC